MRTAVHKILAKNMRVNIEKREKHIISLSAELKQSKANLNVYEHQIAKAESEGVIEFDRKRYGIKRGRK